LAFSQDRWKRNGEQTMTRFVILALLPLLMTGCLQAGKQGTPDKVKRYGMAIGLKPEMVDRYKDLHAHAWPEVLQMIKECRIHNYSIYLGELKKGEYYLFGYFEYRGNDFKGDMAKMAADTTTKKWWLQTDPCQIGFENRKKGDWWFTMEEVFHTD